MKLSPLLAGLFGTVGFAASVLAGLHADNDFVTILIRAMIAMAGCYVVGYVVGAIAAQVAKEHSQRIADKVAEIDAAAVRKAEEERIEQEAAAQAAV